MKLTEVEHRIVASAHLPEDELAEQVAKDVAEVAWRVRNFKWNNHMAIFKRGTKVEVQGINELSDLMLEVMAVRHPLLEEAKRALRLYLSQETPSKSTINRMIKLQGPYQDANRDNVELQVMLLSVKAPPLRKR